MRTWKKWFSVLVLAIATVLVLGACSPAAAPPTPTAAASKGQAASPTEPPKAAANPTTAPAKKPATKLVIGAMDIFSSRFTLPNFVALQKGWFADEGLEIDLITFTSAADIVRAIDAGQINYAITGVGGAINAILQGSKSKILGFGEARAATAGYLVPVDSPIKSYKDIKGKTIAFASPGGYTHWIALASIRAAGLQASDVKLLPAGGSPEAYAAVLAGAADAFHATDGTGSIMVTQGKVRWGWKDTDVIPQLPSSCIYVSEREINDRPDQLKAFLKVYQRADEYIVSNLDDALVMWTSHPKVAQAGMTLDIARKLGELYPIPKEAWTTKLNVEALQTTENLMLETNVIKAKVPWDKVIDQRFLREDLQRVDLSKL